MLHFDMQNLYFLDNPHSVSTDKLGYDFSFPRFYFGSISDDILSSTMFHLSDLVVGLGLDTIHPNKVGTKMFGWLVLIVHS